MANLFTKTICAALAFANMMMLLISADCIVESQSCGPQQLEDCCPILECNSELGKCVRV